MSKPPLLNPDAPLPEVLGTTDIAKLCGVTTQTVQSWIDREFLAAYRTPGGHRRVRRDEFKKFLEKFPLTKNNGVSILIADEDDENKENLHQILSGLHHCQIYYCPPGPEGLVHLGSKQPHFMILDIFHPSWPGMDLIRQIEALPELKNTRFIVITSKKNSLSKNEAMDLGAYGFLLKPADPAVLKSMIFKTTPPAH